MNFIFVLRTHFLLWAGGCRQPKSHGGGVEVRGQQKQSNDAGNNQHNPQHANYWAPRTRKRHQQEHRPQRPTERSDPTQHAKGRTGDCPGPRKETTTRRNVTRGGGNLTPPPRANFPSGPLADQQFSLAPPAAIGLDHKFSSLSLLPLKTQHQRGTPRPLSGTPSLCPATVSLTPSFNGIGNRQ